MSFRERIKSFLSVYDCVLILLVAALSVFGVIIIGSATGMGYSGEVSAEYTSQIMWLATGFIIMIAVSFVDFEILCRFYIPLYGATVALLVLAIVLHDPESASTGTARWLMLPFSVAGREVGIQPSEFAKIFMIIFLAKYIDRMGERINNALILLSALGLGIVPIGLTFIQPALSNSLLLSVILVVMLFMGGVRYKYILIGLCIVVPIVGFLYYDLNREEPLVVHHIFTEYQIEERIKPYMGIGEANPDLLYQQDQSEKALGSGQLTGQGLYNNPYTVPLAFNDFIFAVIGAEFGFVGCMMVIICIIAIMLKCFIIAWRAESFSGKLVATGVGAMIGAQAFVHIGVATKLLPNTGIPLPFVSAGGSSMWINLAAIGMVINIGMKRSKDTLFID